MAKVVDSRNGSNSVKYTVMLFVFALLFTNVLIFAFVFHAVNLQAQYKTKFQLDAVRFDQAVYEAVTNYFGVLGFDSPSVSSNSASVGPVTPSVVVVDGCTWLTPRRRFRCVVDGVEYGVNDYCPYGLIYAIADGRIYCRSGSDVVILRLKPNREFASLAAESGRDGEDRSLVKGPYLHNGEE